VTVPPEALELLAGAALELELDAPDAELDVLEEPPHALIASTAITESSAAAHGRTYLFTDPPPERSCFPDRTI
jgi:hypothetical protein